MTPTLTFDIETIPDVAGLRRLWGLASEGEGALTDDDVAELAFQRRRAANGTDFMPLHLQRVVSISCALRSKDSFHIWTLGEPEDDEGRAIQRFYEGIEKFTPQLVSWNGGGFDLPVLHYRGLIHGVTAPRYWDMGDGEYGDSRDFKWNNYINRYHTRHLDLMDLLAMYQPRANAPMDELAKLMGLPGKLGMDGSQVWGAYQEGRVHEIRNYCETDVVNTYLIYLRFQQMRGHLSRAEHEAEVAKVKEAISQIQQPHWQEYLAAW